MDKEQITAIFKDTTRQLSHVHTQALQQVVNGVLSCAEAAGWKVHKVDEGCGQVLSWPGNDVESLYLETQDNLVRIGMHNRWSGNVHDWYGITFHWDAKTQQPYLRKPGDAALELAEQIRTYVLQKATK